MTVCLAGATVCLALVVPSGQATTGCSMTVSKTLLASRTLTNGVVWRKYRVTVRRGTTTQQAFVQLTTMPTGVRPQLISTRLGWVDEIRDQVRAQRPRALAAVNGGFFYEYRLSGGGRAVLPRDGEVHRGVVKSAGTRPSPVVGVDAAGRPYVGTVGVTGTLTSGAGSFTVTGVNWRDLGTHDVGLYTPAWADRWTDRPAGATEWVLAPDGTVTDVLTGHRTGRPVAVGTRVVAFGSSWADAARRVAVGEHVTLRTRQQTTTGVTLREAVGRGRLLVSGGAAVLTCSVPSSNPRPRTTVGWNGRGQWMTLVVPGSGYDSSGYRIGGLGPPATSNVAAALRFSTAVELDGGGSVTSYLHARTGWQRVDDAATQWQRPVPNGLAFVRS